MTVKRTSPKGVNMAQESLYRIAGGTALLRLIPVGLPYRLRAARTGRLVSRPGRR